VRPFFVNKYSMISWIVNKYLKQHVNDLVDERFRSKMYETYYTDKQQNLRERIAKVRKDLHSSQRVHEDEQTQVLPSSTVRTRSEEPKLPPATASSDIDSIKAKLLSKKR
jgi:nitrogen fixation/metabolism regulation signal transduction histidine kinase